MLEIAGFSVAETAFGPTLTGFAGGFAGARVVDGLPVPGIASYFENWRFQKLSFFIGELTGFLCACAHSLMHSAHIAPINFREI